MNKRIKKKRDLIEQVRLANSAIDFLLNQNNQLWHLVEKMESINSQNVSAINARFDVLEAENKSVRVDLDEAIFEFRKNKKKGLFGRK